jgi:hypothetical protein
MSTKNLLRNGKVLLFFIDEKMSLYVRVQCSTVAVGDDPFLRGTHEVLFEGKVLDAIEDKLSTASILSGITFSGYDPGMPKDERERIRAVLTNLAL